MDSYVCPRSLEYACERGHEHRFYVSAESSNAKLESSFLNTNPFSLMCTYDEVMMRIDEGYVSVREKELVNGERAAVFSVSESLRHMAPWLANIEVYIRKHDRYMFSYMTSPAQDIRWFMSMLLAEKRTTPTIDSLKPDTYNLNLLQTI